MPYLSDDDPLLAAFPYVNGGLFDGDDIEIPPFTDDILDLLLTRASDDFDWSGISPTIFGAVFESTLNPETRRSGGMHYTSIENIHKVIDPLFLDDLKEELEEIRKIDVFKTKKKKLEAFQDKLASLSFLDPAAGSGNFLTESYTSLRKLENEALRILSGGQITLGAAINPVKVSIGQFSGIEINDFAVTVARTALWIAENQMLKETEDIVRMDLDFLPLTTAANIVEGNALRMDWEDVIPKDKLNYIMGNPPFNGNSRLTNEQKEDCEQCFEWHAGDLDYVACWYKKAADYIKNYPIRCAFVSTNSICQGQQVPPLWGPLLESGIIINFAYKTFVWNSEASVKANVHCVIIGFSKQPIKPALIFEEDGRILSVSHINAYLVDAPDVLIEKRKKAISDVPIVIKGLQPTDDGNLILSDDEKQELLKADPKAEKWIRPFISAREYINGISRWCLWLHGMSPSELNKHPLIRKRVSDCYEWRKAQKETGDACKLRNQPMYMRKNTRFKEESFIVMPSASSIRRRYIPFGYAEAGCIVG